MLKRLGDITDFMSVRHASIRIKVMLALLGVLALILPQIVLTVTYMVQIFESGEHVERLSEAVGSLERLELRARTVVDTEFPENEPAVQVFRGKVNELSILWTETSGHFQEKAAKDLRIKESAEMLVALRVELTRYERAVLDGLDQIEQLPKANLVSELLPVEIIKAVDENTRWFLERDNASSARLEVRIDQLEEKRVDTLNTLRVATISDVMSHTRNEKIIKATHHQVRRAAHRMVTGLSLIQGKLSSAARVAGERIHMKVDEANRLLITLVLLTLVYIAVVILVLPSRLIRPLKHFGSVMERAGSGQLDVRARVVGNDEMAALGQSLNSMLDHINTFDDLKRDRIYEDQGRIRAMGDMVTRPMAILDTRLRIEFANKPFRDLLKLKDGYEDIHLSQTLSGDDATRFVSALDSVLRRRRPMVDVPVVLETEHGQRSYKVSVTTGRNRAGKIAYLLVSLKG
jgi:nitrogen fixation/metabolism regulation signal transduction histidine kinase